MREIQSEVAELLGMKRGQDKRISKTRGLGHREFKRAMQEKEKGKDEGLKLGKEQARKEILKELSSVLTGKEKKAILEQERKAFINEGGHTKEEYRALNALNKDESIKTLDDLKRAIEVLKESANKVGNNQAINALISNNTALNKSLTKERQKREKYAKKGAEYRKQRNAQSPK